MQYPLTGLISAANTSVQTSSSSISSYVSNILISSVSSVGLTVGNVIIGGTATPNQITNTSGNNLILTANTGMVEVNNYLRLDNQNSTPTYTSSGTIVYSTATPGSGKTGLFFVNSVNYNDELVAKNRSLLFSMLF